MVEKSTTPKIKFLTCRRILCLMVITCFMTHYMVRVNMSIAIVEMVSENRANFSNLSAPTNAFQWSEHQKNDVLGCFFWGFLLTAIPGGRLSEIYGTRIVLGSAMLMAGILTIVTPFACYAHYYCVVMVRFMLGLVLGVSWPSIPPLAVKWVAPSDSAKFMSHTIACTLGAALALPLCGYIMASLGWPSAFYVTGALSLFWTVFWFYFVYDSPEQHPRISREERQLIEKDTQLHRLSLKLKTPWRKILSSGPVWAIIIADTCLQFNVNVILNELPSYMDEVLHFDIKQNGLLSSLPFIMTYVMAVVFTWIADKWRKEEKFSIITIRKLFTWFSFMVPSLVFSVQSVWGYDRTVSVLVFVISQGCLAASTAGFIPNTMDISPSYPGTIFGLAYTGGASTGFISSKILSILTDDGVAFERWRYVFLILIGINIFGSVFYHFFASGDAQDWNPKGTIAIELNNLTKNNETKDNQM